MAQASQYKFDATKPLFAVVGAGDLAVEKARAYVTDVQERVTNNVNKVERDPKAFGEQARSAVTARLDELTKEARETQVKLEAQLKELRSEFKTLPDKLEAQLKELQSEVDTFAARGEDVVARLRGKQPQKRSTKQSSTGNKSGAKKSPATKAAAKKAPAKKASATKSAAKRTASKATA